MRICCRRTAIAALLLLVGAVLPVASRAGDFQIAPMSLELRKGLMSGTFTVTNEAKEELSLQLSAKAWDQDRDGQDRYTDTGDVVFYPKIMTIGQGEQRVIRLGLKGAPGSRERTYRLFLEEISVRRDGQPRKRAGVAIVMRISLPIFLAPVRMEEHGAVERIVMENGSVTARIANSGNSHFKLQTVTARGTAVDGSVLFEQEQSGWYVLPGASRGYRFPVPAAVCAKLAIVKINAAGETLMASGTLNVSREMCTP